MEKKETLTTKTKKEASSNEKTTGKATKSKTTPSDTKSKGTKIPSKTTAQKNAKTSKKTTKTAKKEPQKAVNKKAEDANTKEVTTKETKATPKKATSNTSTKTAKTKSADAKTKKAKTEAKETAAEPVLNIPILETEPSKKGSGRQKKKAVEKPMEMSYEELFGKITPDPWEETVSPEVPIEEKASQEIPALEVAAGTPKETKASETEKAEPVEETPKKAEKAKTEKPKEAKPKQEKPKAEKPKETKKPKAEKPKEIVKTPQPKPKNFTKEEKKLLAKLEEAFRFVVNMTNVIESQKMDTTVIKDLTLGEVHVLETVALNNNKPMTFIANKQKITVGALTTMINRLVQKGYLVRTRDEMDNRVIRLSVTPQTKKILKSHDKFHDDIIGLTLDGVTIRDATKVMVMFAEVLENYHNPKPVAKNADTKKTSSKTAAKKTTTAKAKKPSGKK